MADFITLLHNYPSFFYSAIFVLSLTVGSFLNVVIYRLPIIMQQQWRKECRAFLASELTTSTNNDTEQETIISLSNPSSSCPHCQHKIKAYENIPVLSWIFLRGQCSQCNKKISVRYPLTELATTLLSLVIASYYGVTLTTVFLLILTWGLVSLTMIDYDHMLLPDQITLPLLWLGLLVNTHEMIVPLKDAVIGAVAGYVSLFSIFWLFKLFTGKDGMGHGDFKLFALFGAWLGWQLLPLLILIASFLGAIVGISVILLKNHKRDHAIPFGPYLAISGWIVLLWGNSMWSWYLNYLYQ